MDEKTKYRKEYYLKNKNKLIEYGLVLEMTLHLVRTGGCVYPNHIVSHTDLYSVFVINNNNLTNLSHWIEK